MHNITAKKDESVFVPFTLHCSITTKETAENIVKLLEHIVYSSVHVGPLNVPSPLPVFNKEQRQWAEDVYNMIEKNKGG